MGAGKSQLNILKLLKSHPCSVVTIDRDAEAIGIKYSDIHILCSTHDANEILRKLRVYDQVLEFVALINASSGPPVVTSATLAEYYGLPGLPPKMAEVAIHKNKLLEHCRIHNIPCPHSYHDEVDYPCVVKPTLSLIGKSGVSVVTCSSELPRAVNYAQENAFSGGISIDEYINGQNVVLTGVVVDGRLLSIALIDELNVFHGKEVAGGGMAVPSSLSEKCFTKISNIAQRLITTMQLEFGPFSLSLRVDSEMNPFVIELHLELPGDKLYDVLLPVATDRPVLEDVIAVLSNHQRILPTYNVHPTAVIFDEGDELVSHKSSTVIKKDSVDALVKAIRSLHVNFVA